MESFEISLTSIADVRQFVNAASMQRCEIDIVSGRYVVDAKSIMGLFSVDLAKPVSVQVHGTKEEARAFCEAVASLVVTK